MNEYRDIEDFVRGRLEEGVPPLPPRLAEIERAAAAESFARVAEHRSRRRRTTALLVAASLASYLFIFGSRKTISINFF